VGFGASHYDTVGAFFDQVQVNIGVGLLTGA
jgi:hypothetical protein